MTTLSISNASPFKPIINHTPTENISPLATVLFATDPSNGGFKPLTPKKAPTAPLVRSPALVVKLPKLEDISLRIEAIVINQARRTFDYLFIECEKESRTSTKITVSPYPEKYKMPSQFSISQADEGAKIIFYIKGNPLPIGESKVERTDGAMGYRLEIQSDNTIRLVTQKLESKWSEISLK